MTSLWSWAYTPMSLIRWRHNGVRLILPAVVTPPAYAPNASDQIRVDALIDTGATSSGLRSDIADRLDLPVKGNKRVHTANGILMSDEFLFRVGLIIGDYLDPDFSPDRTLPYVIDTPILGFGLQGGFSYPLLLGMDVISAGDLTVRRSGVATFAL